MEDFIRIAHSSVVEIFSLVVVSLFFLAGLIGSFVPVVPGSLLIWVGILVHKLWMGPESVSWSFVGWAACAVLLAQGLDVLCTWWGARRFGASWRGALGAVLGGLVGVLTLGLIGLVLGPVLGAITAELLSDRSLRDAGRARARNSGGRHHSLCAQIWDLLRDHCRIFSGSMNLQNAQ